MIASVFSWAVFIALLAMFYAAVSFGLRMRDTSNKLLVVASSEFFEMTERLMKTPEELPASVLDALETMMNSMNNGHGSRVLLSALRDFNSESVRDKGTNFEKGSLNSDVGRMREELQDFFGHAVAAWLNYVTYRHVFYQMAIFSEMKKLAINSQSVEIDEAKTGISLLPRFPALKC